MVIWGDENYMYPASQVSGTVPSVQFVQNAVFTHSYGKAGTYTVNFTIRNTAGYTTMTSASVVVTGVNTEQVSVTSPNGGERWNRNSTHSILWNYKNAVYGSKVDLYLSGGTACPLSLSNVMVSCQQSNIILDKNIDTQSVYNWIVGTDVVNNTIPLGDYRVMVCVAGTSVCDTSDGFFSIVQ
jgi:PKD repeat protein